MNRRLLLIGGIALLIILLAASLTTAWARQNSLQSKARDRASAAQLAAAAALGRAVADGVAARRLAPYRVRLSQISHRAAPSALPFWSSQLTTFYGHQVNSYRMLVGAIHQAEMLAAAQARDTARRDVRALAAQIGAARSLDLPVSAAQAVLRAATSRLRHSTLPRQYAAIPEEMAHPSAALAAAVAVRRTEITGILTAAHRSRTGVVQRARAQAASVQRELALLGLVTPRATKYRDELTRAVRAVQIQPNTVSAAVQAYSLQGLVARVTADYRRTVPRKMIVVSTEKQNATLYQNGKAIYTTLVTTGGPELPTDHGVFHIYLKISPFVFHSPWPPGSPYYYIPTPVTYWMPFDGGEGLHDAWWRSNYGPGSNFQPTDLGTGNYILGTHGCVNLPFAAAQYIWNWAPLGTTVVVI